MNDSDGEKKHAAMEKNDNAEVGKEHKKREWLYQHDKRRSMRRKSSLIYEDSWNEYEKFMLANLEKKKL